MKAPVKFKSFSMFTQTKRQGEDWYDWCVFVDESDDVLDSISSVEYELHPSFPDPVRISKDRESRFAVFSSGWGGFTIGTRVTFRDGEIAEGFYVLKLQRDDWPKRPSPDNFPSASAEKVYKVLFSEKSRWRQVKTISSSAGLTREEVFNLLRQLSDAGLARKAYFAAINGEELWGATQVVGISPSYKDTGPTKQ